MWVKRSYDTQKQHSSTVVGPMAPFGCNPSFATLTMGYNQTISPKLDSLIRRESNP